MLMLRINNYILMKNLIILVPINEPSFAFCGEEKST